MSSFSKNLQRFLVLFFTATSIVLVVVGVIRIKKPTLLAEVPTPTPNTPPSPSVLASSVTITGNAFQTPWGNAVASITVKGGKVIAATMPQVPNSPPSEYAKPFLIDQAIKAGSANIQGVSGATYTSLAFKSSLESAIVKANAQGQEVAATTVISVTATSKPSVPRKYRRDDDDEWDDD